MYQKVLRPNQTLIGPNKWEERPNVFEIGPNDNCSRCLLSDSGDRDGRVNCKSNLNVFLKLIFPLFTEVVVRICHPASVGTIEDPARRE